MEAGPRRRPNQATQPGRREENICHTCVLEDTKKILAEQDGKNRERRDPRWDVTVDDQEQVYISSQ
jgi:hypothetical protein